MQLSDAELTNRLAKLQDAYEDTLRTTRQAQARGGGSGGGAPPRIAKQHVRICAHGEVKASFCAFQGWGLVVGVAGIGWIFLRAVGVKGGGWWGWVGLGGRVGKKTCRDREVTSRSQRSSSKVTQRVFIAHRVDSRTMPSL